MDCSPPGSSVHGILQTGILEWVAMPSSRGSSRLRYWTCVFWDSCIAGKYFTAEPHWGSATSGGKPHWLAWGSYITWFVNSFVFCASIGVLLRVFLLDLADILIGPSFWPASAFLGHIDALWLGDFSIYQHLFIQAIYPVVSTLTLEVIISVQVTELTFHSLTF